MDKVLELFKLVLERRAVFSFDLYVSWEDQEQRIKELSNKINRLVKELDVIAIMDHRGSCSDCTSIQFKTMKKFSEVVGTDYETSEPLFESLHHSKVFEYEKEKIRLTVVEDIEEHKKTQAI